MTLAHVNHLSEFIDTRGTIVDATEKKKIMAKRMKEMMANERDNMMRYFHCETYDELSNKINP